MIQLAPPEGVPHGWADASGSALLLAEFIDHPVWDAEGGAHIRAQGLDCLPGDQFYVAYLDSLSLGGETRMLTFNGACDGSDGVVNPFLFMRPPDGWLDGEDVTLNIYADSDGADGKGILVLTGTYTR